MGYRHYIGYIPKKELPEILKQAEELKAKIGEPNPDEEGEVYSEYDVTRFMRDKASCLFGLGKLYWSSQQGIYDLLYKNKTEDFSNDDTEFFFINDNKFLYNLSVECQRIWIGCLEKYKDALTKSISSKEKIDIDTRSELLEISQLFDSEIRCFNSIEKRNQHFKEQGKEIEALEIYNKWQYNYIAVEYFLKHSNFDYENNQLCVFAY